MKVGHLSRVHPLIFRHKFGSRYGSLFNNDFLLGRNPYDDNWMAPEAAPAANIVESKDHFELVLTVPGYKIEDINIQLKEDTLTIEGAKSEDMPESNKFVLKEYEMDTFKRVFKLAAHTDPENIVASLKNGELRIKLYHKDESKPSSEGKTIPVH